MSYLALPRLSFFGTAYTNPSTANNNDMASVYDVDTVRLNPKMELFPTAQAVHPPAPEGNSFNWSGADDNPDLRNWLMGLMEIKGFHEDEGKDGIGHGQMGHWNYYGDHNTEFQKTRVNGAVLLSGESTAEIDPALQLQVEILGDVFYGRRRGGVLVDVDPYALVTSQIFTGQFRLTYSPKPNVSIPVLIADHPTPAYSYFISPYKNLGPQCEGFEAVSSVFQFALKKENLSFIDDPAFISPAIQELKRMAMSEQGLMVRYCFYDALYEKQAVDLNEKFRKRQYDSNPYVGKVLGSIGIWKKGELATAPVGRKLRTQIPFEYVPPKPHLTEEEHRAKRRALLTTAKYRPRKTSTDPTKLSTAVLGATLAEVDTARQVVTLDCASTFPEADPQTRKKFDLGPMQLVLQYGADGSQSVTIGDIPYDQATYERGGGVVDVSYAKSADKATIEANLAAGQLVIFRDLTKTSQLLESNELDVLTDNRSLYFDLKVKPTGKDPVDGTATIRLRVRRRGAAITEPAKLN
ncbi:MAG: hypothetical protein NT069_25970, partial [Planctomycetota bacterium]|nr:hypothetical protein [Planctomycetota bacterium]